MELPLFRDFDILGVLHFDARFLLSEIHIRDFIL